MPARDNSTDLAHEPIPGQRVWWAVAALGSLALVIRTGGRTRGVITDHLEFGRRLLEGAYLYAPYDGEPALHPPYPPTFGLLTAPFSLLGETIARYGWGVLQVAALWTLGLLLWRWLLRTAPHLRRRAPWLLATALLATSRYWLRDTHGGGGNLINTALVLGACELCWSGRRVLAGVVLGASLATKPNLIWFLPVLLIWGRHRTVWTAVGTGCGAILTSLVLLRFDPTPWQTWIEGTLSYAGMADIYGPALHHFPEFEWMNQNLRSAVYRYLGTVPAEQSSRMDGWFPGLGLPHGTTAVISSALNGAILLVTLGLAWRMRRFPAGGREQLAVAATLLVAALMVSPLSWKAHHVALLPVLFLILLRGRWQPGRRGPWILLGLFWLTTQIGEELTGKTVKNATQGLYIVTFWDLLLWGHGIWWLHRQPPPEPAGSGDTVG